MISYSYGRAARPQGKHETDKIGGAGVTRIIGFWIGRTEANLTRNHEIGVIHEAAVSRSMCSRDICNPEDCDDELSRRS